MREMLGSVGVGAIINRPQMQLSEYGVLIDNSINEIPLHYPDIIIDKYGIMPNHIHIILFNLHNDENGRLIIAPTNISVVIQQLKRYISKRTGFTIWQKSFHDHIIRNEEDYKRIWRYIDDNPSQWALDRYNPTNMNV